MKVGTAEPTLPNTFPNLTTFDENLLSLNFKHNISAILLVNPSILVGLTALSVDIVTVGTLFFLATLRIEYVPKILFLIAD